MCWSPEDLRLKCLDKPEHFTTRELPTFSETTLSSSASSSSSNVRSVVKKVKNSVVQRADQVSTFSIEEKRSYDVQGGFLRSFQA